MAWIESHEEIGEHPKTLKLATLLKVPAAHAVGLLHCLWHFTLKFAWRDGNLRHFGAEEIARGSKWEGDCTQFVSSLQKAGWLDNLKVHDWKRYAGEIIYQRNYNAKRKGLRKVNKEKLTGVKHLYAAVKSPLPYQPNHTIPNQPDLTNQTKQGNSPPNSQEAPNGVGDDESTAHLGGMDVGASLAALAEATAKGGGIAGNVNYKAPRGPLGKLLLVIKQLQGFRIDDSDWDKVYPEIYGRAAKDLLKFFGGDWKLAGTCAKAVADEMTLAGKTWTPQTLVKHAPRWKNRVTGK